MGLMAETREYSISWGALWKFLAMLILVAVVFVARDVLVATALAIILSSALDPLVSKLEVKKIPRILGALAIYLAAFLLVAIVVYILVPVTLVEMNAFFSQSTETLSNASASLTGVETQNFVLGIRDGLSEMTQSFIGGEVTIWNVLFKFLGGFVLAIAIFVLSFYMVIDRNGVKKFLITIAPTGFQGTVIDIYERVRQKISSWFLAQIFLSAIVGLAVFIGLWLLGVKYSLTLGILAAILEIVPYVGPIVSGGVAVLFALSSSPALAFWTVMLFILIQQLEAHLLVPSVMGRSTKLSPVVVLIALLIGGQVFGIIGVILAVPIAVTFQEILYHWSTQQNSLVNEQE
ncbi:MAG: hypothetical protein COU09_00460 [Candidatus Harrisonbacteria bacterium CG10_big_fil_rev_8_21_14_0_10_44_23]|uniref:AI-2E family transporter n=1 Tax=Candidatus Harrisonbacteria bacterium CG10_big_fil_rev_8_21_14_0_10_44_23 TaxID=1974585 RepID=A0A2H0USH7_9BACT|nr:MAG: hypothetical protein COU09_00460 [Candidatus Harrisonbacteria bacterium CG10_big_fil_rev_8_21_14_0_10_44_23]